MRCGLVGCGVVGSGVVRLWREAGYAPDAVLSTVVVRDTRKPRDVDLTWLRLSDDPGSLLEDPELTLVIEATGDTTFGRQLAAECLSRGKAFVTAGKDLVARHGLELEELARARSVPMRFEAAVGGALPVVALLRLGLSPGVVGGFEGVLNGTCNFILSRLHEGLAFEEALEGARRAGFAEPDSRRDTSGRDTADKLTILARLCGVALPPDGFGVQGIAGLTPEDAAFGRGRSWSLKLLGSFRRQAGHISARVAPAFVAQHSFLGQARDEENAVLLDAGPAGTLGLVGRGAGSLPTASAILADVREIASGRAASPPPPPPAARNVEDDPTPAQHYLRVDTEDGFAALRSSLLGAGIALDTVVRAPGGHVQLLTTSVSGAQLREALAGQAERGVVQVAVRP